MTRRSLLLLLSPLLFVLVPVTHGQSLRYELGKRLRRLELAWEKTPVTAELARKRALPRIQEAVGLFFGFKLRAAAGKLDQASYALRKSSPFGPALQFAHSLQVVPPCRLIELGDKEVPLTIKQVYETPTLPSESELHIRIALSSGSMLLAEQRIALKTLPQTLNLPHPPSSGDFTLSWAVTQANRVLCTGSSKLSFVRSLDARLSKIRSDAAQLLPAHPDAKTVQLLLGTLTSLCGPKGSEADHPAAQLFAITEQLLAQEPSQSSWFKGRSGEAWLRLPLKGGRSATVRVFIPESATTTPRPFVMALHGMGGSENLWFDGYGNGAIVDLCRERDWILCAPKAPGFGAPSAQSIAEALADICHIDSRRRYLVGHSMGAGHIGTIMKRNPAPWRALAFLGGTVRNPDPKTYAGKPVYIGAGALDFGLRGARRLHERLEQADLPALIFNEWPLTEHLTVVQEALPEVFKFFDAAP